MAFSQLSVVLGAGEWMAKDVPVQLMRFQKAISNVYTLFFLDTACFFEDSMAQFSPGVITVASARL